MIDLGLEDAGYIHENDVPDVAHLRDYVEGALEAFYNTGDVLMMEVCLDELSHTLNIPMKLGKPFMKSLTIEEMNDERR